MAWGRLGKRWGLETRENKVDVYTKFIKYRLEYVRQKPMDWLALLKKELGNTGHIMDGEMFITLLLNSLTPSEYEGAIIVMKDKLRKGDVGSQKLKRFWRTNTSH